jgi:mRNA-degrading endonuclease RelE of RelBE toxin-antitoxin system
MAFVIEFSPNARDHLKQFRKRDQCIIVDAIASQLGDAPDAGTRNRKRLDANPVAPWELRIGDFRVFYDINPADHRVVIVAIGEKTHNRLTIAGEEIEI